MHLKIKSIDNWYIKLKIENTMQLRESYHGYTGTEYNRFMVNS